MDDEAIFDLKIINGVRLLRSARNDVTRPYSSGRFWYQLPKTNHQ